MSTSTSTNSSIIYTTRLSESDTVTNKLIYQVKQHQLSDRELNKLQARCSKELSDLRNELNVLLHELRVIADLHTDKPLSPSKAA
ncbi:hypothetical protein [Paenibacillus sp. CF384]|uniref:hypothetical protein n=1 Tax=Paenibacillus sp. CF384 TaxID=1884382 RepID=UPI00089BF1B7|nr:hypothetical protein [Paenibacillus sp. CF384]SDX33222.1 hypothetical protein SAMN05518855_101293 [Paenibacillus sp. CF384]